MDWAAKPWLETRSREQVTMGSGHTVNGQKPVYFGQRIPETVRELGRNRGRGGVVPSLVSI